MYTEIRSSGSGLKLGLQLVEMGEYVSVCVSQDGMYSVIYVNIEIARGKLNSVNKQNCVITVDETEYSVDGNMMDNMNLTIGMSYIFYAGKYGEIVAVSYIPQDDIIAAYVYNAAEKNDTLDKKY